MKEYRSLVEDVLKSGTKRQDRTGTGTISLFGTQSRYDLRQGFPLLTLKKTFFKSVVKELLWFLRGETNINTLGCGIWDEWANDNGELGPVYGAQWRRWTAFDANLFYVDQIARLIERLRVDPYSRRHIVTAWNPAEVESMALPPCHAMFQLYATPAQGLNYYLDLQLYQRSADLALGVPFNIASYALLLKLIAREVDMAPRFFIHSIGDAHIYDNHLDGIEEMLSRKEFPLPNVKIADKPIPYPGCLRDGSVLEPDDFTLVSYQCHPFIKLPVAV